MNVTAICNKQGHWEPSTDDICAEPRGTWDYDTAIITSQQYLLLISYLGSLLSEDGKIAVASSVITLIISSVVFFTFGYICRHYRQKQTQALPIPVMNRTPVYENVIPEQNTEQDLELKENIAYGPITCAS